MLNTSRHTVRRTSYYSPGALYAIGFVEALRLGVCVAGFDKHRTPSTNAESEQCQTCNILPLPTLHSVKLLEAVLTHLSEWCEPAYKLPASVSHQELAHAGNAYMLPTSIACTTSGPIKMQNSTADRYWQVL